MENLMYPLKYYEGTFHKKLNSSLIVSILGGLLITPCASYIITLPFHLSFPSLFLIEFSTFSIGGLLGYSFYKRNCNKKKILSETILNLRTLENECLESHYISTLKFFETDENLQKLVNDYLVEYYLSDDKILTCKLIIGKLLLFLIEIYSLDPNNQCETEIEKIMNLYIISETIILKNIYNHLICEIYKKTQIRDEEFKKNKKLLTFKYKANKNVLDILNNIESSRNILYKFQKIILIYDIIQNNLNNLNKQTNGDIILDIFIDNLAQSNIKEPFTIYESIMCIIPENIKGVEGYILTVFYAAITYIELFKDSISDHNTNL